MWQVCLLGLGGGLGTLVRREVLLGAERAVGGGGRRAGLGAKVIVYTATVVAPVHPGRWVILRWPSSRSCDF